MKHSSTYTTVYFDIQDPANQGWAYTLSDGSDSGPLDGYEGQDALSSSEAAEMAYEALAAAARDDVAEVVVHWRGESAPIRFSRDDLEPVAT